MTYEKNQQFLFLEHRVQKILDQEMQNLVVTMLIADKVKEKIKSMEENCQLQANLLEAYFKFSREEF